MATWRCGTHVYHELPIANLIDALLRACPR